MRSDGYDISKLSPTADGGDIVYNASTNKFIYYADNFTELAYGDEPSADDILVVVTDAALSRYGLAESSALTGANTIQYCVYSVESASISTTEETTIWLYTENITPTVDAANALVYHYGSGTYAYISDVAKDSYHLYEQEIISLGDAEDAEVTEIIEAIKETAQASYSDTVITEATCEEAGSIVYTSADGTTTKKVTIPATGHNNETIVAYSDPVVSVNNTDKTYTSTAYIVTYTVTYKCSECDKETTVEEVEDETGENWGWTYEYTSVYQTFKLTGYSGLTVNNEEITDIEIPYGTTELATGSTTSGIFYVKRSKITSVTIPETVTTIGGYVFYNLSKMTSITIPNTVTSIGIFAFCLSKITSVVIPDSVETIGNCAFQSCTSLSNVSIGSNVTSIGNYAFNGCSKITSVVIPDSVKTIGTYAFQNCTSLSNVSIGSNVTSIGDYAFNGCSKITSVVIPDSVETIGTYAFQNCTSLSNVSIGSNVTSIGNYAFNGCSEITSVTIPDSVETIGNYAFYNCYRLVSVTLGSNVKSIGNNAFYNCYKLLEVRNLSSLTLAIGETTYGRVAYYAKNILADLNSESTYLSSDDYMFYYDGSAYYFISYTGTLTEITLPDSINGNSYDIYQYAFYSNTLITSVTISNGVTSIGRNAFYNCTNLANVTIPSSVTDIGEYAFQSCNVKNVYITDLEAWCNITFSSDSSNPMNAYSAAHLYLNGEIISGDIVLADSVTTIPVRTFINSSITSITIGSGVTAIGDYAFYNCTSLTSIIIPEKVTTIGSRAFYNTGLTSVTFEKTTTWKAQTYYTFTDDQLSDVSYAASALTSYFYGYTWTRT